MAEDTDKRPALLLPWRLVLLTFAALCLSAGAVYGLLGLNYVPVGVSGMVLGIFGTVFGDRIKTTLAIFGVAAVALVSLSSPHWVSLFVLSAACAVLSGLELARFGTRVSVFAIMSWIILHAPTALLAEPFALLITFVATSVVGMLYALFLKVETRVPAVEVGRQYVYAHAGALAVGLALAQVIATYFENAQSHWIALLFTARALDPPGQHLTQASRRGAAMVGGAGLAGIIASLPLATTWFAVGGLAFMLAGLRYLPSGYSASSGLMSAGIVLATSPTTETALFRAQAAIVASILVLLIFIFAAFISSEIQRHRDP